MKLLATLLVIIFLATPIQAKLKFFPTWKRLDCGGQQFACYDFRTAKRILGIDLRLQLEMDRLKRIEEDLDDMHSAYANLEESNEILRIMYGDLEVRLKQKHAVLEENTLALVKAEDASVWSNIHWIVTAAVVIGTGAFVGGYYLGKR